MLDDAGSSRRVARRRLTQTTTARLLRRSGGLAIVCGFAIALAACGGPGSPSVAQVPKNGGGTGQGEGTTAPKNDAAQLLVEWAACMRRHGDPTQSDPTIDAHDVINIYISGRAATLSNAVHNGTAPCNGYLAAASSALRRASPVAKPPDESQLLKYSRCMRVNGEPNYPDPGTGNDTNLLAAGIDPNSALFVRANNVCGKQIKAPSWWISGSGPPGDITVQSGPSGQPPPGARPRRPNVPSTTRSG